MSEQRRSVGGDVDQRRGKGREFDTPHVDESLIFAASFAHDSCGTISRPNEEQMTLIDRVRQRVVTVLLAAVAVSIATRAAYAPGFVLFNRMWARDDVKIRPETRSTSALPRERAGAESAHTPSAATALLLAISRGVARLLSAASRPHEPTNRERAAAVVSPWSSGPRRIDLDFGVGYDQDPEHVVEVLEVAAKGLPEVLESPAPAAVFLGCRPSTLDFRLSTWTNDDALELAPTRRRIALAIRAMLRDARIENPCPNQRARNV
jgi:hypothetical protein